MARKEKDTRRIPGYQVESQPRISPPEGKGPVHTEPVRWYIEAEGVWTSDRKRARTWPSPSEALRLIRECRARVGAWNFVSSRSTGSLRRGRSRANPSIAAYRPPGARLYRPSGPPGSTTSVQEASWALWPQDRAPRRLSCRRPRRPPFYRVRGSRGRARRDDTGRRRAPTSP